MYCDPSGYSYTLTEELTAVNIGGILGSELALNYMHLLAGLSLTVIAENYVYNVIDDIRATMVIDGDRKPWVETFPTGEVVSGVIIDTLPDNMDDFIKIFPGNKTDGVQILWGPTIQQKSVWDSSTLRLEEINFEDMGNEFGC